MRKALAALVVLMVYASSNAYAFFFFFPIPNVSKPAQLQQIIDALEKSIETRALAFVSENKTFSAKQWTWGTYTGYLSQEEANRLALQQCDRNLSTLKGKTAGGQPLYDFGDKKCELHPFTPNDGPKTAEANNKVAEEARKIAAEEQAKWIAAQEDARKEEARKAAAAEEESKRVAAEEEARKVAVAEEAKRLAAEDEAKRNKAGGSKKIKTTDTNRQSVIKTSASSQVDFNAEANKAARILGCQPTDSKVLGIDGANIQYAIHCDDGKSLNLSCDQSGLCLQQKQK